MGLFTNKYPYSDFHELNLDWILEQIRSQEERLINFVALNTIKYADPIAWDIRREYQTNTVVINPMTGDAYISVKPVPSNVAITDKNYWSIIFNYNEQVTQLKEDINAERNARILDINAERDARINMDNLLQAQINMFKTHNIFDGGKKVLILGDSLSADSNHTWVKPFTEYVASKNGSVDNRAVGGATIASMLSVAQNLTEEYDIVIIFCGINDVFLKHAIGNYLSDSSFAGVYKRTIDAIRNTSPNSIIYGLGISYYAAGELSKSYNTAYYNVAINNVCRLFGCVYVDMCALPNYAYGYHAGQNPDGVHPTEEYSTTILYEYILAKIITMGTGFYANTLLGNGNVLSDVNDGITIAYCNAYIQPGSICKIDVAFTVTRASGLGTLFKINIPVTNGTQAFGFCLGACQGALYTTPPNLNAIATNFTTTATGLCLASITFVNPSIRVPLQTITD